MSTSCNVSRTKAYREDLKWRVVWQSEGLGLPTSRIAANLSIDRSTVCRMIQLFCSTGSVDKQKYPSARAFRKLTEPVEMYILHLVISKPDIYLKEIQAQLLEDLMVEVDMSTICRFLQKSGFTHQKLTMVALQRDDYLHYQYMIDISVYKPSMLIFLDETGADRRQCLRKHGYGVRKMRVKKQTMLVRGERFSAIAIMSVHGILDVSIHSGTTNGDIFSEFVQKCLIPQLQPYDGINEHSVVIMDNCAIHHVAGIQK